MAESRINLKLRPWVNSADYWNVRSDLLQNIKPSFDASGISIPYPQREIHLHNIS